MAELEKSPIVTFVENLTDCPMCFDEMEQPKLLHCGHSFCLKCLRNQCEANNENDNPSNIKCALCRSSGEIPITGLEGLPSSFVIEDAKQCLRKVGRTRVKLPVCDKAGHNQVLNVWCETCNKLICIVCRDHHLHDDHSVCPATPAKSFEEYCKQTYRNEKKIAELELANANIVLEHSQCQTKADSLSGEIKDLNTDKNKMIKLAKTKQEQLVNITKRHETEMDKVRSEHYELQYALQVQIESLVDEIGSLNVENTQNAERLRRDKQEHENIKNGYQKELEKMVSEHRKQQIQLQTKIDSLAEEKESLKFEKVEIAESAMRTRKHQEKILTTYQKELEKTESENRNLRDRLETSLSKIERLNEDKSKIVEEAIREGEIIIRRYQSELDGIQSEARYRYNMQIISSRDERASLELERSRNLEREKILKREKQALLFVLIIIILSFYLYIFFN
ncbi:uncharacterized protein [Antedon mediterranea]|uniref:uncharacterized protein n=1 Tax=Antedon mediterranea TaxID=105859 RepID=UPI003AF92F5B